MTLACLYGRVQGNGSLAVVTEGFRSVLTDRGLLAGVHALDVAEGLEPDPSAGVSARHGIYTGPLGQVEVMFKRGLHQHYWIMVAPNSDRLPPDLVALLAERLDSRPGRVHLMAPSAWAADVVESHFSAPCHNVPHGIDPEHYRVDPLRTQQVNEDFPGAFRVIHFSTSAQQRKGTLELIQAWQSLEGIWAPGARLLCVLDRPALDSIMDRLFDLGTGPPDSVRLAVRADLPPSGMANILSMAHVVCQPSRGEAFGLIPLQALCCGVPVVATDCTGHAEYMGRTGATPGVETIGTGDLAPIDDLPGALAPALRPESVASALKWARSCWGALQAEAIRNANDRRAAWSWKETLGPFVERIRST